jgi:hypothetical protein
MGATAVGGSGGFNGQSSPLKVGPAGQQHYNAISAHGTFYNPHNQQHRKTYSNKLPSIGGAVAMNNKTVDSSLSNTYYSRE